MTPRTNQLYAANERNFGAQAPIDTSNAAEMAKTYANVPVNRIAAQLSAASNGGADQGLVKTSSGENKMLQRTSLKLNNFVNMNASQMARPPQPSFKLPTNLGQMKAPSVIIERPTNEECDYGQSDGYKQPKTVPGSAAAQQNNNEFKLEKSFHSPNSIAEKRSVKQAEHATQHLFEEQKVEDMEGDRNNNGEVNDEIDEPSNKPSPNKFPVLQH